MGRWLDQHAARGTTITVACSGGADSLALAVAAESEAVRQGHPIVAATVDHGLQPGSTDRAEATAELLRTIGYPQVRVLTVTVDGRGGMEAAARKARYDALYPVAGDGSILLGHTLDDQAETVLLGLSRGSGPRSIAGMAPYARPYGRPLLGLRRSDTELACAEAGLTPWQDPHNVDPAYTRVRIRHEVLPLLEDVLGGGVAPALARTAGQLQEDAEVLDALGVKLARAALVGPALRLDVLQAEPAALRRRAIRWWLLASGQSGLTSDHLQRVDQMAMRPGGTANVRLPGGFDVVVRDQELRCEPANNSRPRKVIG